LCSSRPSTNTFAAISSPTLVSPPGETVHCGAAAKRQCLGATESAWTVIVVAMTAANPFDASPVLTLQPDTSPTAIRDALIDEELAEFERAYHQALAEAATTLDLTRVLDVLRHYHASRG
jgi:hypothetical protein